jgi:hypothetical protein
MAHIRATKGQVTGGERDQGDDDESNQPATHELILWLPDKPV